MSVTNLLVSTNIKAITFKFKDLIYPMFLKQNYGIKLIGLNLQSMFAHELVISVHILFSFLHLSSLVYQVVQFSTTHWLASLLSFSLIIYICNTPKFLIQQITFIIPLSPLPPSLPISSLVRSRSLKNGRGQLCVSTLVRCPLLN